jgi:hypothetical protein
MVPGRLSALTKMINPRRYTDRDFMEKVGADLYGGKFRGDAALLREHAKHLAPPTGKDYLWWDFDSSSVKSALKAAVCR